MPSKKNLKQRALLEHRIIMQAALCVEDLLQSQEKEVKCRPWMTIVEDHMRSLFLGKRPVPQNRRAG